ncbi:MAG: hypothetical protein KJI70_02760 [Patescibacteria group bacterium]|nr:hypothetical protein [Patescibacteria group bacterium]
MSLIEILIVIFIVSVALSSVLGLTSFSLSAVSFTKQSYRANIIAQQLLEQVRNFRDETNWDADGLGVLMRDTDYYIIKTGSPEEWQMIQGTETIDGFTRKVIFNQVGRDGSDNIVESGGAIDLNTKKIIATVSWGELNKSHQIELITYLTNWK